MTEQTETEFWAAERARDAAARGRYADPAACGTCKTATSAGGQVQHDECAQRATLLPAPDAPGYELITGMSEEEVWALPARFHTPVFLDTCEPKAWVCAVCWGDGWNTQWPCKTAQTHGAKVFTPEHQAETAAKKQTAELSAYRALGLGDLDGRVSAACGNPEHPTWLRKPDDTRGCPWCRTAQVEAQLADMTRRHDEAQAQVETERDRRMAGLRHADEHLRSMNEELQRYAKGTEAPVLWSVYNKMHGRAATAEARVTELESELAEYEPLNPQQCPKGLHADWLIDSEHTHACPWCRIAELEALKPAPIQTCRVCGAGYTYGQPCSTCEFNTRMAAETGESR
ncbi:hypothetical protein ACIQCF_07470 [Streptomyces sp. NPDC088353]|uniref:hypothetical protein n=1 Tax=Streptomyces sp. NPDC088353 TaxID=3365855 RepID=UPI003823448E